MRESIIKASTTCQFLCVTAGLEKGRLNVFPCVCHNRRRSSLWSSNGSGPYVLHSSTLTGEKKHVGEVMSFSDVWLNKEPCQWSKILTEAGLHSGVTMALFLSFVAHWDHCAHISPHHSSLETILHFPNS